MPIPPSWERVLARYATLTSLATVRGKRFTIQADGYALLVTPESTGLERRMTRADYERAASLVGGPSHELAQASRNSSYVVAILADFARRP